MEEKKCSKDYHCQNCYVANCSQREEEISAPLKDVQCSGNCSLCDGAIGYHNDLSKSIPNRFTVSIRTCGTYHLITHHGFEFPYFSVTEYGLSEIEKINLRLNKCNDTCKYSEICKVISSSCNFTSNDVLNFFGNIDWNFKNQKILYAIPEDKHYAFCICDKLQAAFKASELDLIESFKKLV